MDVAETDHVDKSMVTNTLEIPVNLLAKYDGEDDAWSWGLSPRVQQIPTQKVSSPLYKRASRHNTPADAAIKDLGVEKEKLEPDFFLHVVKCKDVPEKEPELVRPKTPAIRLLTQPVKQTQLRPDETFLTDPGTFFGPVSAENVKRGEARAVVVRREVNPPPPVPGSAPSTLSTLNHTKTLVVRADNEEKKPKLALVKELDNTMKPNFTIRKPKEMPKISEAKKFKSVPFVVPDLSSKERKNILSMPADKGSKLEFLQKRLRYDARKYAKCNVKTGSSTSESSEEEEEEEESSDNDMSTPTKVQKGALRRSHQPPSPARQSWMKGTTNISFKRALVANIEDSLSEADKSIIANLEAGGSQSVSTPAAVPCNEDYDSSRDHGDSGDGDTGSDVSVTAEDMEMFDRWVEADTPTSKDIESDRAASIEIQHVLGIDNMSFTPPQSHRSRKRSDTTYRISESEGGAASTGLEEGDHVTVEAEGDGDGEGVEDILEELVVGSMTESEDADSCLLPLITHLTEAPTTPGDKEQVEEELQYKEPSYEDVLNITGKTLGIAARKSTEDTQSKPERIANPEVTLLSTWAPDSVDAAVHYSVHHFCTLAVQPQLPRVLHNITRSAHCHGLPVTIEDVRSQTELSWFEEGPEDGEEVKEMATVQEEEEMKIEGCKPPAISDKHLYWTPAPPKMDLPPLFIKTHLFPQYESAIASAEQQAILNQAELEESSTSEEETESDETDEEDRELRKRVLTRRHGSSHSVTREKKELEILGPDKIKIRSHRLTRPGSAPILSDTLPHQRYKSDYYSSYADVTSYQKNMSSVHSTTRERSETTVSFLRQESPSEQEQYEKQEKQDKLVRPYTNISEKGVLSLTPPYSKLLPISSETRASRNLTKRELKEVKECLIQSRELKKSTSCPSVREEIGLKKRAGSCTNLSETAAQWEDYNSTISALKDTHLPAFAHKLGTLLSKDILQLHQIIKKENPGLYSDLLNEVHRLSVDIEKGGDYLHYNRARRGALYVKLGMFKDAMADLDSVIAEMPQMADAYWHRHLIYVIQGDMNTALNDLTNIIRHNQNQPRVYLARAEIYWKQGDITGAILNYSQALKRDSSNAETYYKRAALFEEKGDILLALEDYTVANKLCPSNTVAILKKGKYNFERGAYSVAVADFTAMLEQEPYNSIARTYRGRAYAKMGKYTNALEDLSCAIHLDPSNHLPFYHRAVLLRKENPKRALQDFSVSILLNPTVENNNAYLHRGILYADLQRYEEAVPDFESVVELDWNNVEAHINLGLVCVLHLKQYKRAIRCFAAAIDVDPTNHRAYVCRGDAYKSIKKHDLALIDYTRAIHIRPDVARYYLYRGKLLLEMGNLDQASQHIRFASVLNTGQEGTGAAALQKAVVQSFLHNYDDAIFVLDRAAGLEPSPSQYILLGKTYLKAKRFSEAVDNFEKALMYMRRCRSTVIPMIDGEMDYRADLYNLGKNPKILKQEMPKSAAEVYFLIGKCHVESGNYPSALEALNSAIRINPAYSEAYFQRGLVRIWVKSQRPLLDFNRALAYNPNYFQAYLTRAAYFGMKGRYSKAMFNCNEALKIQPKSVRAYLYRGALKFEIKNYRLAVEDLCAAIKLDPLCSIGYYNRAVCYQHLKKNKNALIDYGIVLLLETELNQKVLLNRGLLYYQSGDYDNALVDFKLAVKDSPDNALLYHTLGLCYHRNNQLKEALQSLTHAMTLKEHFTQAYISRGNVYMSLNTVQGYLLSKRDYCRALHYNPTNLTAHVNLGIALQSYGKMNEAWKQFTAAINIDPSCFLALEARSIVNLQMGHLFGAFCDINTAVKLHPTPIVLTNRGVIQQYMNDPSNAMQDFQQAIEADPTYSLAYFNAANLYFNMRLFEKALKYYDAAVTHCVSDEGAVLNRAIAKVLLKDHTGAIQDFDTAISLNPFAAHSYFNRANLYLTMGENVKAEEDYRKALSLQPNDSSSYSQLAVALGRQFKKIEALDTYKLAIKLNER